MATASLGALSRLLGCRSAALAAKQAALEAGEAAQPAFQGRALAAQAALLRETVSAPVRSRQVPVRAALPLLADAKRSELVVNCVEVAPGGAGGGGGEGKDPLVLAHGFGAGLGMFFANLDALASGSGRRVLAVDWLGMGSSGRPPFPRRPLCNTKAHEEATVASATSFFLDSFESWREAEGIERMVLGGHSLGGYLSGLYAASYPERVSKLVLISPAGVAHPQELPEGAKEDGRRGRRGGVVTKLWGANVTPQRLVRALGPYGERLVQRAVDGRFASSLSQEPVLRALLADYLYEITTAPASGEYAMNALLTPRLDVAVPGVYARRPLADSLRDIQCETTMLFGSNDWIYHPDAATLAKQLPAGSPGLGIIQQAGHNLFLDRPREFNAAFLNAIS